MYIYIYIAETINTVYNSKHQTIVYLYIYIYICLIHIPTGHPRLVVGGLPVVPGWCYAPGGVSRWARPANLAESESDGRT